MSHIGWCCILAVLLFIWPCSVWFSYTTAGSRHRHESPQNFKLVWIFTIPSPVGCCQWKAINEQEKFPALIMSCDVESSCLAVLGAAYGSQASQIIVQLIIIYKRRILCNEHIIIFYCIVVWHRLVSFPNTSAPNGASPSFRFPVTHSVSVHSPPIPTPL